MWKYNSPIGTFYIKTLPNGRYGLIYKNEIYETSHTPQAAADNVYLHCTGCYDWDQLDCQILDAPTNLCEWEHC